MKEAVASEGRPATTTGSEPQVGRVFVSAATNDAKVAKRLVADLEGRDIPCWIAPRDVPPGAEYAAQITRAIHGASVMLFLFSGDSNKSGHCRRELQIALDQNIAIVPIRLDDSTMSDWCEYVLCTMQWIHMDVAGADAQIAQRVVMLRSSEVDKQAPGDSDGVNGSTTVRASCSPTRARRSAESIDIGGRAAELEVIEGTLAEVAESGRGRLLLISGESGVGKSVLANELTARASARGFIVSATTCGSFIDVLSCFPVREIMRQLAHSSDLVQEVKALYGADTTQVRMASVVESEHAEPRSRHEAMLGTFANIVFGRANTGQGQPMVLLLDDLENVDPESVDGLLCLLARIDEGPVLVVGVYRSDTVESKGKDHPLIPLLDAARRHSRDSVCLEIGPLRRQDYPNIISAILGGPVSLPFRLLDYLWRETEGNALFLREIVRAVGAFESSDDPASEARLVEVDGEWHFVGTVDSLTTPKSVEDAIAWHLRSVDDDERSYLQLASVIGKQFDFDIALEISHADEDELLANLEKAVAQSIIREMKGKTDGFEFKHNKIREVLYNQISQIRRKRTHSQIADLLAAGTDSNTPERESLIGEHLYLAERFSEAAAYLSRSAQRLMNVMDANRAAALFRNVQVSLQRSDQGTPAQVAEISLRRIEALTMANDYDEAASLCQALIASEGAQVVQRGWALDYLGDALWATGDLAGAREAYSSAEAIATKQGELDLELEVCADLAELHDRAYERSAGLDPDQAAVHKASAESYLDRQFALSKGSANPAAQARAFRNHARRLRRKGFLEDALVYNEKSLAQMDAHVCTHRFLISYAKTLRFAGRPDDALVRIKQVLDWSQQTGARRSMGIALHWRALLSIELEGATDEAMSDLDDALKLHEEIGYERGKWEVRTLRGEWYALRGDRQRAVEEFRNGLDRPDLDEVALVSVIGEQLVALEETERARVLTQGWQLLPQPAQV